MLLPSRVLLVLTVTTVALLAAAPTALAWRVDVHPTLIGHSATFNAEPGEQNSLIVTSTPSALTFTDGSGLPGIAGAGCVLTAPAIVTCSTPAGSAPTMLLVGLGDGDDRADLASLDASISSNVSGQDGNDELIGASASALDGGPGNDILRGGDGANMLIDGPGNDLVYGGAGDDTFWDGPGADIYHGGPGSDRNLGTDGSGRDIMHGGPGDDFYTDGAGADTFRGGAGDDEFTVIMANAKQRGGSDSKHDRFVGGAGIDTAVYASAPGRTLTVTIGTRDRNDGLTGSNDTIARDVEHIAPGSTGGVNGQPFSHVLRANVTGTALANHLYGSRGADRLRGGGGADVLEGFAGNDLLIGGRGRDTIDGGDGNDTIQARDGAKDRITCGRGTDTVIADRSDAIARDCERVTRR